MERPPSQGGSGRRLLVALSFALALAASLVVLFDLLEQEGLTLIPLVAVPVALTGLVLALQGTRFARRAAAVAAVLLASGISLAVLSIGVFYLPSAIAMAVAAFLRR